MNMTGWDYVGGVRDLAYRYQDIRIEELFQRFLQLFPEADIDLVRAGVKVAENIGFVAIEEDDRVVFKKMASSGMHTDDITIGMLEVNLKELRKKENDERLHERRINRARKAQEKGRLSRAGAKDEVF